MREQIRPHEAKRAQDAAKKEEDERRWRQGDIERECTALPERVRESIQRAVARGNRHTSVEIDVRHREDAETVFARVSKALVNDDLQLEFEIDPNGSDQCDHKFTAYYIKVRI